MRKALVAIVLLLATCAMAHAQRCPAGQDQFLNCLSSNPQMRARQEQWANQPAARRIPGAQPYGAASGGAQTTINRCVYAEAVKMERRKDPRYMRFKQEGDRRGGTFEAGKSAIRDSAEAQSLQRELFRKCRGRQ